jgi:hypothetical protein
MGHFTQSSMVSILLVVVSATLIGLLLFLFCGETLGTPQNRIMDQLPFGPPL